jgi:cytochrome c nitrite reductase small subunit
LERSVDNQESTSYAGTLFVEGGSSPPILRRQRSARISAPMSMSARTLIARSHLLNSPEMAIRSAAHGTFSARHGRIQASAAWNGLCVLRRPKALRPIELGMPNRNLFWFRLTGWSAAWIIISAVAGSAAGVGAYTFYYAQGASYLSNDAQACTNCHIMQEQYDAWLKSSHRHVAVCNDCHAPHGSLVAKYVCKGRNGFFHSLAFTTGKHPDPIRITDYNRKITEQACRYCHSDVVHMIDTSAESEAENSMSCIRCHYDVGHFTH